MTLAAQPRGQVSTEISLVDLLDRLLGTGVVLVGDIVISLAGVDLVRVQLEAMITSVRSELSGSAALGKRSS